MRLSIAAWFALALASLSGCGYHTLGAAAHLPPDVKTLAVPVFATRTEVNGTETAMTEAVVRELLARTRFRVTTDAGADADAVLQGTILKQAVTPLTYNAATQQWSSSPRTTAGYSTRTRATSTASSTSPRPTCPRSSRKTRRRFGGFRGSLRGNWWRTFWKGCEPRLHRAGPRSGRG
jgi:hypothetical protein